jgi:hypothetical protein
MLPDALQADPVLGPIVNRLYCAFAYEAKLEVARNLLAFLADDAAIAAAAGLSLEQVRALRLSAKKP